MSSQMGGAGTHPSPPTRNHITADGAPVKTQASTNPLSEPGQNSEQPINPDQIAQTDEEMPESPKASQTRTRSTTCIPKAPERIRVELPSQRINGEIQ